MARQQPPQRGAHLGADRPFQGDRGQFNDGDVAAQPACRAGDLGADEPGADDDQMRAGLEGRAEGARVVKGAQHVDALTLARQAASGGAGGDHDAVGRDTAS